MPSEHPQDDLLIMKALHRHYLDLKDDKPDRANRALELATDYAAMHGLTLDDAHQQIEWDWYDGDNHPSTPSSPSR